MKTKILVSASVYLMICILVFNACCKKKVCTDPTNPECINYDACFKKIPNAGFKIRQTAWDSWGGQWSPSKDYISFGDTCDYSEVDLVADFQIGDDSNYIWKFDGMSTFFKGKLLKGFSFWNYLQDSSVLNYDIFYAKPLGVTLTVKSNPNNCIGNDTIYSQKRQITFTNGSMYKGEFRGSFSTNPNKIVDIAFNQTNKKVGIYDTIFETFVNFPFLENDSLFVFRYGHLPVSDFSKPNTYYHYYWENDPIKYPNYIFENLKGIVMYEFTGHFNSITQKNDVVIQYKYKTSKNAEVQLITFTGYQTKQLWKPWQY
jgi:hypothetical protein